MFRVSKKFLEELSHLVIAYFEKGVVVSSDVRIASRKVYLSAKTSHKVKAFLHLRRVLISQKLLYSWHSGFCRLVGYHVGSIKPNPLLMESSKGVL